MVKRQYYHRQSMDFKRIVTTLENQEEQLPVVLVEYFFDGKVHPVQPMLHKTTGRQFIPQLPSVINDLDQSIQNNPEQGPASLYAGAVGNAVGRKLAEMPRNRRQVNT